MGVNRPAISGGAGHAVASDGGPVAWSLRCGRQLRAVPLHPGRGRAANGGENSPAAPLSPCTGCFSDSRRRGEVWPGSLLDADLVVDEPSMIELILEDKPVKAIPRGCASRATGPGQLPAHRVSGSRLSGGWVLVSG
jgi:hypothetical protein